MRKVAQPISIVTLSTSDSPTHNHGATVSSLTSISLDPPLIAFSLKLPSRLGEGLLQISDGGKGRNSIRVYLLSAQQESLARAFARQHPPIPSTAQHDAATAATMPGSTGETAQFPSKLFEALEATSIGFLNCTMIKSMNLHALAATSPSSTPSPIVSTSNGSDGEKMGLGSELFIVRVDSVVMNEEVIEGKGGKGGSLVYWDHQYRTVGKEEA